MSPIQDSSINDEAYGEPMDTAPQQVPAGAQGEGSKLPPVLANLMGNMNNSRSPQAANVSSNPAAPSVNVQELLSSIMVRKRWAEVKTRHCGPLWL